MLYFLFAQNEGLSENFKIGNVICFYFNVTRFPYTILTGCFKMGSSIDCVNKVSHAVSWTQLLNFCVNHPP